MPTPTDAPSRRTAIAALGAALTALACPSAEELPMSDPLPHPDDRYARGWARLREIDGDAGERVVASLRGVAPDLGRYIIEFAFGDVYSRPGLGLREREIATVAALVALGTATPQLRVHLGAALNVGVTPAELVEVIVQMAVYAGFPAALNGVLTAREIFAERGVAPGA